MVGGGQAGGGAARLFFNVATAFRIDLVQPPWGGPDSAGVGFPYRGFDHVWATWGLAAKLSESLSFGISLERSYSQNAYVDGLFGISAAVSWRPYTAFGFAAVARDFNRPSPAVLLPLSSPGSDSAPVLDGRYALAMAFRPTGRRDVDIGLEAEYWPGVGGIQGVTGGGEWIPRGTLGVDVPGFGRAFASVAVSHLPNDRQRGVLGTAGLELHFEGLSVGGGALFGSGISPPGSSSTVAEYATVAV